jgi:serine protease Do
MEEVNRNAAFGRPTTPLTAPTARRPRSKKWTIIGLTLLVAALVVIVGLLQARAHRGLAKPPELPPSLAAVSNNAPSPAELSRSFREVIKSVKDAVVFIDVKETVNPSDAPEGLFGLPLPKGPQQREGAGSGFVATEDGFILTNNHVIRNASDIEVTLADGRKFKAEVIGKDPATDIAVIHINAGGLPIARLGNSDDVQQGDWVLALGNPFGLQQTITAGIISATGRELGASQYNKYLQTDAPINPGNSGGPLVNMQGEVIGINAIIYSRSGANEGIGFAIPSNLVNKVYAQLLKNGKVTRAYLGLYPAEVTPGIARNARFNGEGGALVNDLSKDDSPAARAGLRSGDIIVEVDGKKIASPKQLVETVADLPVGRTIDVKYIRDGRMQSTKVTLAERPTEDAAQPADNDDEGENPG